MCVAFLMKTSTKIFQGTENSLPVNTGELLVDILMHLGKFSRLVLVTLVPNFRPGNKPGNIPGNPGVFLGKNMTFCFRYVVFPC